MAFDPLYSLTSDSQPLANPSELIATVRTIATDFMSDIDRARSETDDWQDHDDLAYALVDAALSRCLGRLTQTGCWGRDNQAPSGALWQVAGNALQRGWLQERARNKPLGYAGDYEMLARIMTRTCCDDPLGKHFDRFFQNQSAPRAVRSRTEQIAISLAEHTMRSTSSSYRVTSTGCGPGIDIARGLAKLPTSRRDLMCVRLLDLDPAGLDYAAQQIAQCIPNNRIDTHRENIFRLARNDHAADRLGQPDFLVCSGLFDYLGDEVACELLRLFWERLAPGGRMVIGNFVPRHPARAYMEWIGNWYLIYRTADQFAALAQSAGIPQGRWSLGTDRTGTDLFLIANKE